MSALPRAAAAAAATLRARGRTLLALALLGALVGLGWGLSAQPEYASTATVIVLDRGDATEAAGSGVVGAAGPAAAERLLELARGEDVAELAAASLGGDVSGADLLARTEFRSGDRGGALVVRSQADTADLAAAAANAFAGAVVQLGTLLERRRLRSASENLAERLVALDPASEQAIELQARLDAIADLQEQGPPLRPGREAELPTEAEPGRSVALSTLAGAGLGALVAIAVLAVGELYRRPVRSVEQLRRAVGAPVAVSVGARASARTHRRRRGSVSTAQLGDDRMQALAAAAGLDPPLAGRRALAVVSPMPGEGRTTVTIGLAAAAAWRNRRVMVVEADLRMPTISSRLGIADGPGLSDYLGGHAAPRDVIRSVALGSRGSGGEATSFVCVTAGTRGEAPLEMLSGPRFGGLLDQLQRVYDLVLIDTPPLLVAGEGPVVARSAGAALLCAAAGVSRLPELRRALGELDGVAVIGSALLDGAHLGAGVRRLPPPA